MTYPIIQYRLTQGGRIPEEVLAGIATGFSGECSANTNKAGCIPKWIGSQKNQYLGLGIGTESNIQGLPEVVTGVLTTKTALQNYITEISGSWTTQTNVTTGIVTTTEVGIKTAFPDYGGDGTGITTTKTTPWVGSAGAGTTVGVDTSNVISDSETTSAGITTLTRTIVSTTVDEMSNPYDPAAKATELWDIYEAVNGL
tara:strand:+ start:49 stop:645 length:597 start_codon:yes stop_codon:yes gene_type:complete